MRSLRAGLSGLLPPGWVGLGLWAAASTAALADTAAAAAAHPYFPLAVGNRWTYRCSTEGTPTAGKVLQIRQQQHYGGRLYFRAELKVGADALPLVQYFSVDADGGLRRSLGVPSVSAAGNGELLLAADTAAGSTHGSWRSAGHEQLRLPALRQAQALRVENFSVESPTLPASQRAEWRARYYVRGVGPVGDADGLGGRCDLTAYRLVKPAVSR